MTTSTLVERRRLRARLALTVSTILCSGLAAPASAQDVAPAPVRQSIDGNGVDLFLGTYNVISTALTEGQGDTRLSYYQLNKGDGWADNVRASLNVVGSTITVSLGAVSDSFTVSGSTYIPTQGNGASLSFNSGTNMYTYTRADGTLIHFNKTVSNIWTTYENSGSVTDIVDSSGQKLIFSYDSTTYCTLTKPVGDDIICIKHGTTYRLASARSSFGYKLTFIYSTNSIDPDDTDYSPWMNQTGVSATNLAVASGASTPTMSTAYSVVGSTVYYSITDPMSRVSTYRLLGSAVAGIKLPGSSTEDVTVAYASGKVSSVTTASGATSYGYADLSGERTTTVTDALSHATIYKFDIASNRMKSMTNALGNVTSWTYDTSGRPIKTTRPEGDYTQLTYDTRGNVTENRKVAKSGSGTPDIVTSAAFDSTCSNPVTCNQPNTTTDALGNVTSYSYDTTTGDLLSITAPVPTTGAVAPQTRYSYTSLQAYFKNSGGSIVGSGEAVSRLTGISTCQTTASCAAGADEVKTTIAYGPQTTGVGNNLQPVSVSKGAGDGSLTATTTVTYDDVGNLLTVDGPLSGTADTTTYRYDTDREPLGTISADPDGVGSLKRRAVRTTYSNHGVVTKTELGTVNGTTDTDWAAFATLQQDAATLDAADRKTVETLTAGGTTYGATQYSYDSVGRPDCTALRMNSAAWSTLPSSACTAQTAGSEGPDRISKNAVYDALNRATTVTGAYGTGDASSQTVAYNPNGTLATLTDANGNKTTYEYDGVDRLVKTRYPSTTAGSGISSTTDYEQLVYDPASEVTSRRLRGYAADGTQHIDYGYDHLGRLTSKDLPGSELDVSYGYDLLDRPTSAATSAQTLTFGYDALSRMTSQGGPLGTVAIQYDTAGRRTRLTWPDTFFVTYDYDVTGNATAIRENGAASGIGVLATFAYDDLGRRTGLTRGNGTTSTYGYDGVSRLSSLAQDLSGTTNDLTLGFGYNPASQIRSATRSNDLYAWSGAANRNDASSINGLNQVTNVGVLGIGYDLKGNLSTNGSAHYTYSSQNLLLTGPSSAALTYDPLDRLYQESGTSVAATRFQYDGLAMIGEYDGSGVLQRRYVDGPGSDEPLVEYDKSGASYVRSWLHADERGSIVATSNDSGAKVAILSYDEYGVPTAANTGRFGYTGQAWLPSVGLWYYKARMYASGLGRFLQTDPIGYGDGINWYNYVGVDPINLIDPAGLSEFCHTVNDPSTGTPDEIITNSHQECYNFPDNDVPRSGTPGGLLGGAPGSPLINPDLPDIVVTPKPCIPARQESGTIVFGGFAASGTALIGFSVVKGQFLNTKTGTHGTFVQSSWNFGLDVGISGINGRFRSLSSFVGGNDNYFYGGENVVQTRSYDLDGNHVGDSVAIGPGPSPIAGGSSFSETELTSVHQTARCEREK